MGGKEVKESDEKGIKKGKQEEMKGKWKRRWRIARGETAKEGRERRLS